LPAFRNENEARPGSLIGFACAKRSTVKGNTPGEWSQKPGKRFQERRFTGTVGSTNTENLPNVQIELDISKYGQAGITATQTFDVENSSHYSKAPK
jgi:hypothetical protein